MNGSSGSIGTLPHTHSNQPTPVFVVSMIRIIPQYKSERLCERCVAMRGRGGAQLAAPPELIWRGSARTAEKLLSTMIRYYDYEFLYNILCFIYFV